METHDRAGREYWDETWRRLPKRERGRGETSNDPVVRLFARYLRRLLRGRHAGERLLEVGCANSSWLPFFARDFGFEIAGLDYSEAGCQRARDILSREGIAAEVICADLFHPPPRLLNSFDVVVSFGLVEHFDDTATCLASMARFARPGGVVITSVPNLAGAVGLLQRFLNRRVFDVHVVLDRAKLAAAHRAAHLEVLECKYFLFANFGVCNAEGLRQGSIGQFATRVVFALLTRASMFLWRIEDRVGALPANRFTSPYVVCTARRSTDP